MLALKWILAVALLTSVCVCTTFAQMAKQSALTVGVRQYTDHPDDSRTPFGKGDLSYLLAYEYHEGSAFWQCGLSYTPHATSTSMVSQVESVVTPQLRLVFEENLLVLGVGVLKHYIRQNDVAHWSDLYWEVEAGLHASLSSTVDARAMAFYTFKKWGDLGDFDTSEVEFGLDLAYRF